MWANRFLAALLAIWAISLALRNARVLDVKEMQVVMFGIITGLIIIGSLKLLDTRGSWKE